jgi:hypothetical protein
LLFSTDLPLPASGELGPYEIGVVYRLDPERLNLVRVAGAATSMRNALDLTNGANVLERELRNPASVWPCGGNGKFLIKHGIAPDLYVVEQNGILRRIAGGSQTQPIPVGDPFFSSYGVGGIYCFPDGAILLGDGQFQKRNRDLVPTDYVRFKKVFGDEQVGELSQVLGTPLTVQAVRSGAAVAGRKVSFRILRGNGTLSQSEAITDGQGLAGVSLRLADRPGVVWVEGRLDTGATVVFRAVARFPVRPIPRIYSGGVGGAALSVPFLRRLAPGGIATIFG